MTLIKHKISLELAAGIYILLFLIVSYFFGIGSHWYHYLKKSHTYAQSQKTFLAEKNEALQSLHKQSLLLAWKNKHRGFFDAQQSSQTFDQITHQIIAAAMKAHFTLMQASPIISKATLEKNIASHSFEMKITGNYLDLFSFISDVIAINWPITLTEIKAESPNQFDLIFMIAISQ